MRRETTRAEWVSCGAIAKLFALSLLAALALAGPLHAQDIETPTEPATPATPAAPTTPATPASPETPAETSVEQREVLVPAQPEKKERRRLHLGPQFGLFVPSSSKVRDRFGKSWFNVGIGLGSVRQYGFLGTWSGELFIISNTSSRNRATLIPVGLTYRRDLTRAGDTRPYVGISADLLLNVLRSREDNVSRKLRSGASSSLLAGVAFLPSGYLEARYLVTTRVAGFNLSGLRLNAGIRF